MITPSHKMRACSLLTTSSRYYGYWISTSRYLFTRAWYTTLATLLCHRRLYHVLRRCSIFLGALFLLRRNPWISFLITHNNNFSLSLLAGSFSTISHQYLPCFISSFSHPSASNLLSRFRSPSWSALEWSPCSYFPYNRFECTYLHVSKPP